MGCRSSSSPSPTGTHWSGRKACSEGNLAAPIATQRHRQRRRHIHGGRRRQHLHRRQGADRHPVRQRHRQPLAADADTALGNAQPFNPQTGDNLSYDNELLDTHYVAGDGRVNENIGLTAIQELFHSEHDRLLAQIKTTVQQNLERRRHLLRHRTGCCRRDAAGNPTVLTPGVVIQANEWNGERLFQAAKFGTETEYQHIVFDEFARYVAPAIHVAGGVNVHIDPAITSEFANVVYRFGHSMLDENITLYELGADGKPVIGAERPAADDAGRPDPGLHQPDASSPATRT